MKNLMPEVAKLLGVELGEHFELGNRKGSYVLNSGGLFKVGRDKAEDEELAYLLLGLGKIIKQLKLSQAERAILENLPEEYQWIGRSSQNKLVLFSAYQLNTYVDIFGYGKEISLFSELFKFIKASEEPYNIKDLLGD